MPEWFLPLAWVLFSDVVLAGVAALAAGLVRRLGAGRA